MNKRTSSMRGVLRWAMTWSDSFHLLLPVLGVSAVPQPVGSLMSVVPQSFACNPYFLNWVFPLSSQVHPYNPFFSSVILVRISVKEVNTDKVIWQISYTVLLYFLLKELTHIVTPLFQSLIVPITDFFSTIHSFFLTTSWSTTTHLIFYLSSDFLEGLFLCLGKRETGGNTVTFWDECSLFFLS